jgi:hypothetical protein
MKATASSFFGILLLVIAPLFLNLSCDGESTEPQAGEEIEFSGHLSSYTGCKPTGGQGAGLAATQECIEWSYDGESTLNIAHINAGFNCCPDSLVADIQISGDTISIDENEILVNGCRCLCLFDLTLVVTGVAPGSYQIEISGPYMDDSDPETRGMVEFTVDLSSDSAGSYCVERDHYPWNIGE